MDDERKKVFIAAAVVAHTLWTSAAPSMVYPLYAEEWGLSTTMTTAIFAVYPATVVLTLLVFGDLADHVGGRLAMLFGITASAAGTLAFAAGYDPAILFIGRVLMGVGVGLSAGPSAAALVEFLEREEDGARRASTITIAAQAIGLAAALLIGGGLAEYAPVPTRLSFLVLFGLLLLLLWRCWTLPRPAATTGGWSPRPRLPAIPAALRAPFGVAAVTVMAAYVQGALIMSLGAQIARELVQSSNLLVNSAVLAMFAVALGLTGLLTHGVAATPGILWGTAASFLGMAALAVAVLGHSLPAFFIATASAGIGYALMVYGGLAILNSVAPPESRGGMTSAVFLLAYLFSGALALALGKAATLAGTTVSVLSGAAFMGALSLGVALLMVLWSRRLRRAAALAASPKPGLAPTAQQPT
jgi:hypothetical protein